MTDSPTSAFQPCVRCHKGDTTTVHVVGGEREFHGAFFFTTLGLDAEEADALFVTRFKEETGREADDLAAGERVGVSYRLCASCGEAIDCEVREGGPPGTSLPATYQDGEMIRYNSPN